MVDADTADVNADEPIWKDNEIVGFVASGGYAHWSQKSVAIGFMPVEIIAEGAEVEIEILGGKRVARVILEPLYDADASILRS